MLLGLLTPSDIRLSTVLNKFFYSPPVDERLIDLFLSLESTHYMRVFFDHADISAVAERARLCFPGRALLIATGQAGTFTGIVAPGTCPTTDL
jgi:hypothetical protein